MPLTSPFSKLFTDLQTYILAEVTEIKWVDHDFDQLEISERPPVKFPCLLIDFNETVYEDQQFSQYANMRIRFRLAFDRWQSTSSITPDAVKELGLQYYEIEQKLHEKLQGWNGTTITLNLPFKRVRAASEKRELLGMRIRELNYECQYEDSSVGGA